MKQFSGKRYRRIKVLLSLVLVIILIAPIPAQAYVFHTWMIRGSETFIPTSSFTTTSNTHVSSAFSQWNYYVNTGSIFYKSSQTHTKTNFSSRDARNDGINRIYKVPNTTDFAYVGRTEVTLAAGSSVIITDIDININAAMPFANSGKTGSYDFWSIMLHEAGHAAGIDHSQHGFDSSIMHPRVDTGVERRTLFPDDIHGIRIKYN